MDEIVWFLSRLVGINIVVGTAMIWWTESWPDRNVQNCKRLFINKQLYFKKNQVYLPSLNSKTYLLKFEAQNLVDVVKVIGLKTKFFLFKWWFLSFAQWIRFKFDVNTAILLADPSGPIGATLVILDNLGWYCEVADIFICQRQIQIVPRSNGN